MVVPLLYSSSPPPLPPPSSQAFYEAAVRGVMVVTETPLFTLVALDEGVMVGVVTAQIITTEKCGDAEIISSPDKYSHVSSGCGSGGSSNSNSRRRRNGGGGGSE